MLRAVIFDMDGLMIDSERVWEKHWPEACKKMGVPFYPGFINEVRGTAGAGQVAVFQKYWGTDVDYKALFACESAIVRDVVWGEGIPAMPGLHELLEWLAEHNIPCAVASASLREMVEKNLSNIGVTKYFSRIITGDMVENGKPDPAIFLLAAQKLGVDPAECLVLEDSHNGIRAGRAAGMITVMVPDTMPLTEEMEALSDAHFDSLTAVRDALEAGDVRLGSAPKKNLSKKL